VRRERSTYREIDGIVRPEGCQQDARVENFAGSVGTSSPELALQKSFDRFTGQGRGDGVAVASTSGRAPTLATSRDDDFEHKVLLRTPHRVDSSGRGRCRIEHIAYRDLGQIRVELKRL
jgi:hypothetical protein